MSVVGYHYRLGYHMGLCRGPVNSIVETRTGDKTLWKFEITTDDVYALYYPMLFGGEDAEGGVMGELQMLNGGPDQEPPDLLVQMAESIQPGFRRMCTVFWNGIIGAMNPYPKPWSFRVRRTTEGWDGDPWYPEKAKLVMTRPMAASELTSSAEIHAMNPAHIVYECLTNREWGRGLPRAALNDDAFRYAADYLFNEGFGMCLRWTRTDSIASFVQSVIDHIGGVLRPNRVTGELELKLIRDDFVTSDLPLFDADSGLLEITEASVATLPSIINHVTVKYTDPITGKTASIAVHNLAGIQGTQGEVNTLTKDYPGIPTPALAARVAQRDLRASSSALRKFTFKLDRRGQAVRPGDAIRIRDIARNIPDMVVRVGRVENGTLLNGAISVTAVQDVFGLPANGYIGSQIPKWQPPNTNPCIGYNRSFELPYFMLARSMSAADLDYVKPEAGYLGTVVELGGRALNAAYKIAVRDSDITPDDVPSESDAFCPTVPDDWQGGDTPCVCYEFVLTGVPVAPSSPPGGPADYLYEMNGVVVSPSDVININPQWPLWGPPFIDYTADPDMVSDISLNFIFAPEDSAKLTETMSCRVYDDSDEGNMIYETTLYRAGGADGVGARLYFERFVPNLADLESIYPTIHVAPGPANPAADLVGHNLRFVLKTASLCCGGLPPAPVGTLYYRLSALWAADTEGTAWIDGTLYDATGINGSWVDSIEKIILPGVDVSPVIEVALLDDEGNPLPEDQQIEFTASTNAPGGTAAVYRNSVIGNSAGVPGGSVFVFGGAPQVFNRTVTITGAGRTPLVLQVHYPNPVFTQFATRAEAATGDPAFSSASCTGTVVTDSQQNILSNTLDMKAFGSHVTCPYTIFNSAYFGFDASATFEPSGVDWADDSALFYMHNGGNTNIANYVSSGLYIDWSDEESGCVPTPGPARTLSGGGSAGPLNLTRFIQFVDRPTGGSMVTLPALYINSAFTCTPVALD